MNIINSSVFMKSEPTETSPLETECLFGETVEILEERLDWVYCKLKTDNYCGWIKKEGLGKTSIDKLLNAIEYKQKISLDKFIYALGIRQIGESNAKLIALRYNSFDNFLIHMRKASNKQSDSFHELVTIDQIGENIANDLILYFNTPKNLNIINKLIEYIIVTDVYPHKINSSFTGKIVVLTGTLNNMSRDEAKNTLQSLGAKISNSLSKNTDYLILGDQPGSKAKKALELNVKIINENEWYDVVILSNF